MKKTIFPLFIFIVLPFISCNNSNNDSKMIVPSAEPSYTVTINSSEGTTVMNVDATSKNVTKSTFTDTETGFVTRKEYIHDNNLLNGFGHGCRHFPSVTYCFLIGLPCGAGTCCNSGYFKPGMIL